MKTYALAAIFLFLLVPISYASKDIIYDIQSDGDVRVYTSTDNSNYANIIVNDITSKQDGMWSINITDQQDATYRFILPRFGVVDYINANSKIRIEEDDGRITVSGSALNKTMNVFLQYSVNDKEQAASAWTTVLIIVGVLIVVSGIIFAVLKLKKQKRLNNVPKRTFRKELYTERQLKIINYIKQKGTVTQAELERELKLPKSSLSRNIESLVQKGILFKETKGMSNVIGFRESS